MFWLFIFRPAFGGATNIRPLRGQFHNAIPYNNIKPTSLDPRSGSHIIRFIEVKPKITTPEGSNKKLNKGFSENSKNDISRSMHHAPQRHVLWTMFKLNGNLEPRTCLSGRQALNMAL